jgi:endothelin-converting enzyme/putative endopeptidase
MRDLAALLLTLSASTAFAQTPAPTTPTAPATPDAPLSALPYTPSLDVNSMDKSVDPCEDFYQYSCGGWKVNNPLPADQSAWSVYAKLAQDNQRFLWGILANLAQEGGERNAAQQKIGDYFAACMDEKAVQQRGAAPLQDYLAQIGAMQSKRDLPALLTRLHLEISNNMLFGFASNQDLGDSSQVIAFASTADAGLPDRDYYLKNDAKSKEMRAKYQAHVARMLELAGDAPQAAKSAAAGILRFETALAKASLSRVDQRDPYKLFHKTSRKQLQAMTPAFAWDDYLRSVGFDGLNSFNVTEPAYLRALNKALQQLSLNDIKTYLRWQTTRAMAPFLSQPFVDENFGFYQKTLLGVPEQKPRWKRCVQLVDLQLGEALGQEFVSRAFSPQLKEQALHMTRQIEAAMKDDIDSLKWMSEPTKEKAREKLHAVANKIGYPDTWRDYSSYSVSRSDFAGNVVRGTAFEVRRQLAKIGKPLDRSEWGMTPPTVNAYYNPQMNDINFPAGVLQPPLYDAKLDAAPNYGNTGGTIGHELIHGFDDEGRQFDAKGNLKDWWAKQDAKAFNQRSQCIVDQYAQYTIVDDIKINSKLTLGEDAADLGGLILAWMAWKTEIGNTPLENRDGLTPEQRFFVGTAQWACENERPERLRVNALTNPHSPGKYRINGLVANMPEFAKAFSCKPGQAMVKPKEKLCRVW